MNPLVLLAKSAVESFIREGKIILPSEDLPEKIRNQRAGTFVTIEKLKRGTTRNDTLNHAEKELRGCIGTYLPIQDNIAEEIIYNAVAAATGDYRFGPIIKKELPYLFYTVYILSEPELIDDVSKLDPKKFGVIVKTVPLTFPDRTDVVFDGHVPYKTGLLLPGLEGVETVEQQISIACQKGGIDLTKEKILIYRFTVERHKEEKISPEFETLRAF